MMKAKVSILMKSLYYLKDTLHEAQKTVVLYIFVIKILRDVFDKG